MVARLNIRRHGREIGVPSLDPGSGLPSVARLHRAVRRRGRRAGVAAAFGHPQSERINELPGRTWIEKSVDTRLSEIRRSILQRRIALAHGIPTTGERLDVETSGMKGTKDELSRTVKALNALPTDRSPGRIAYAMVLGLLAAAEYPTLQSALQTFPADKQTRTALTFVLSGVLAVAAHYLAKSVRTVVDEGQHPDHDQRRFERRLAKIQVAIFFVAIVGLMVSMGLTRGESFVVQAGLTGGAFGNPELLAGLMLTLQLLLFVVAVVVGLLHAEGDRARTLRKQRRQLERRIRKIERNQGALRATQAHMQEELDTLAETERLWIEREQHLLGELLARHDHAYESAEHSLFTRLLVQRFGLKRA